jgi:hypothetical protein
MAYGAPEIFPAIRVTHPGDNKNPPRVDKRGDRDGSALGGGRFGGAAKSVP